jgi:hypothetical protein
MMELKTITRHTAERLEHITGLNAAMAVRLAKQPFRSSCHFSARGVLWYGAGVPRSWMGATSSGRS